MTKSALVNKGYIVQNIESQQVYNCKIQTYIGSKLMQHIENDEERLSCSQTATHKPLTSHTKTQLKHVHILAINVAQPAQIVASNPQEVPNQCQQQDDGVPDPDDVLHPQ